MGRLSPDTTTPEPCGWIVRVTRANSWQCWEPFGHASDHVIRDGKGRVTASAAGYSMGPIAEEASG